MKNKGPILGIAVILITDILILAGAATNRAGEPVQTIELTERELVLQNVSQENSGIDLRLAYYRPNVTEGIAYLDRNILERAGFRFHIPPETPASDVFIMPRVAFVAFEYQDQTWERWLQQAEADLSRKESAPARASGPETLRRVPAYETRLFAVDAGESMTEMRNRHPDPNRTLILRAVLFVRIEDIKDTAAGTVKGHNIRGYVSEVLPGFIHVPLPYSRLLSGLAAREPDSPPRYSVTLSYGRNLEPWVSAVKLN